MKNPDREKVSRLEELPNIGKAMASDLKLVDIEHPKMLVGKDAFALYDELCERTGIQHDPYVIDVFYRWFTLWKAEIRFPGGRLLTTENVSR